MMSFRFTTKAQKEAQLAIVRDLLMEFHEDQLAKTVLSNAIAVFEGTSVHGDLDELMAKTNRWYARQQLWLSVFFVALALFEFAFAYVEYRHNGTLVGALGPIFFGIALLTYCFALKGMWNIQRRYHDSLKWLENMQLELSTVPPSLTTVKTH